MLCHNLIFCKHHVLSRFIGFLTSCKRYMNTKDVKKFFKNASISTSDGWYEINLDKRNLRTPCGSIFKVPHEALALAVAVEWNSQQELIKRHSMHLTNLCCTALDNPLRKTRKTLIESIIRFLETDTICYRMENPPELKLLQTKEWDPILKFASDRYGVSVNVTYGITPPEVMPESMAVVRRHLMSYSDWALFDVRAVLVSAGLLHFLLIAGYHFAVDTVKSLLLVMSVVGCEISVERAVQLASLEQLFQAQYWGHVEWHHEFDKCHMQSRLAASSLFVYWCSHNRTVREKASTCRPPDINRMVEVVSVSSAVN